MSILKYGIDISEHQGAIDLNPFKDGFVIIRVAWGTNTDTQAVRNMNLCEQLGIPYGVYLYSYALNVAGAEQEANYALDLIKGRKLAYPVYFDMEDADGYKARNGALEGALMSKMCNKFCDIIQKAGYYAGVYASESWFTSYLKGVTKYDKWIASWGTNNGQVQRNFDGTCGMLQYSSKAYGHLDGNVAYYDFPAIMKEKGLNGYGKEEPKPVDPPKEPAKTEKYATGTPFTCLGLYTSSTGGTYYGAGELLHGKGTYTIGKVYSGRTYPYEALWNGVVVGFANDSLIDGEASTPNGTTGATTTTAINVGDKVSVINAVSYDGVKMMSSITKRKYTVIEVKGDRVVLGDGLNTAFKKSNLKK